MNLKQILNKKSVLILLGLLVVGIPLTVFLALKQQEVRSRASGEGVQFEFSTTTPKHPDEPFSVVVDIDAGNYSLAGVDFTLTANKEIVSIQSFSPSDVFDTVVSNDYDQSTGFLRITLVNAEKLPLRGKIRLGTLILHARALGTGTVSVQATPQVVGLGQDTPLPVGPTINGIYAVVPWPQLPKTAFDYATCTEFVGWSCDPDDYSQPLEVQVYADGVALGSTIANIEREAGVGQQCSGNTSHGFVFKAPQSLKDGRSHTITVKATDIGPEAAPPISGGGFAYDRPLTIMCTTSTTPTPEPRPTDSPPQKGPPVFEPPEPPITPEPTPISL